MTDLEDEFRDHPAASRLRIIALAPNHWHDQWMNRQYLLSRLGRRHAVLYSNGPWATWDRKTPGFLAAPFAGRFEAIDNVVVDHPGKVPLRVPRVPALDRWSLRLAARRWRRELRARSQGPLVLWIFHPMYAPLVDAVRADRLVYHAYDLYSVTPGWTPQFAEAERRLVHEADLVIASSQATADHLSSLGGRRAEFLPNGVDFDRFADARNSPPPGDLERIPRPRIGYVGSVNPKFDFDLVLELSARRSDWQWVIIGQEIALGESDADKWRRLQERPNVHVLGHKPTEQIASYTAGIDVGLLCYRTQGAWTRGIYPLRLHEHLAAGLPVVSADFPAARNFPDVVWRATSAAEWEKRIEDVLEGRGPGTLQSRQALARANTWDERARVLEHLLIPLATDAARRTTARCESA